MNDIIHLLPDSVANQIAAGEVVDRPASVVKELVENSIDAGANEIAVVIKDAGRTLIQVVDDGKGMSETDARMAFERHATSKISEASDLFTLRTMGFRGEALASIAAISQVELRTRRPEDEVGVCLRIDGTKVVSQEPIACNAGSSMSVKNLFFNTPARRRFLKSDATEYSHIVTIFNRIALVYPQIGFSLFHNDVEMCSLRPSQMAQRIVDLFGKKLKPQLLPIDISTDVVSIKGYVCRPESATKHAASQYFFVNGRYMWHPSFNKAVQMAYERMLPDGSTPSFFISLTVPTETLDVNIHPQKTEVKFENEKTIWSIIQAAVREALGKFNVVPDIDFEHADPSIEIPIYDPKKPVTPPSTGASTTYNPFRDTPSRQSFKTMPRDWEKLYKDFEQQRAPEARQQELDIEYMPKPEPSAEDEDRDFIQFRGKYIVTTVKSGLMLIDQHRAHQRVLFDSYSNSFRGTPMASQRLMFPEVMELSPDVVPYMEKAMADLQTIGFGIEPFGRNTYRITSEPSGMEISPADALKDMLYEIKQGGGMDAESLKREIAISLSKANAIEYGKKMSNREMNELVGKLFSSTNCNNTPDGKKILTVLTDKDVEAHF